MLFYGTENTEIIMSSYNLILVMCDQCGLVMAPSIMVIIGSGNDCHLFSTKPLPETMMAIFQLDPYKPAEVKR